LIPPQHLGAAVLRGDWIIASALVIGGLAMAPLPFASVAGTSAAAVAFPVVLDAVKIPVFRRLQIT